MFQTSLQLARPALAARLAVQQPGLAPLQGELGLALLVLHLVHADGDGPRPRLARQPRGLLCLLALQHSAGMAYLLGLGLNPLPIQLSGLYTIGGDDLLPQHLPDQQPGQPPRYQVDLLHLLALAHQPLQHTALKFLQPRAAQLAAPSVISLPCTSADLPSPVPAPCRYATESADRVLTLSLQLVLLSSPGRLVAPRSSVSAAVQPALPGSQPLQVLLGLHLLVVDLVLAGLVPSVRCLLAPVSVLLCCPTHPSYSGRQAHALGDHYYHLFCMQ